MTEQLDNQGEARDALSSLVNDYSKRVLSDPRMLGNIVTDLLPDLPRERSLLVTAAEADVAGELTRHVEEHHLDPDTAVQLVARSLTDRRALDPAASTWVTTEYAQALGYRVRSEAAPPAAPPAGGGYAQSPPPLSGPPPGGFAPQPAGGYVPTPPPPAGGYAPPMPPPPTSTSPTTDPQSDWQHQQTSPGSGYGPPSSQPGSGYSPPSGSGYSPPAGGGYSPPSGSGYSPPSGSGYSPPAGGGYSPPSGSGYSPPAGGGYSPPSGGGYSPPPQPGGGYAPPSGGGYGPPPGAGGQSVPPLPGQMPWGPPTPPSKKRNLVPLLTAGGLAVVLVIYFAVAAVAKIAPFSSSKASPSPTVAHHTSPAAIKSSPKPTATNPEPGLAAGVAPLIQLMPSDVNPVNCKTAQKPQWSNPGLVKGLACYDSALGNSGDSVFAYQMNSSDNYKSSWSNFNTWWGIKPPSGSGCPPSSGQTQGSVPWDDTGSAGGGYFPTTSGQVLECGLLGTKGNEPTYAWAFPTEDAYIIAIGDPGTTFSAMDTWWTNNSDPNASPKPYTSATP
jgi:hypothetical protein